MFHGGPTQTWHLFDPRGSGAVQSLGQPAGTRTRMWGNVVTYGPGKVLLLGGNDRTQNPPTTNAVYRIDLNGPSPVISSAAPMAYPRAFLNTVTLPTGEVIAIGGNTSGQSFSDDGSVYAAEIWNPDTNQWRTVASSNVPRNYHSTGLLLRTPACSRRAAARAATAARRTTWTARSTRRPTSTPRTAASRAGPRSRPRPRSARPAAR